MSEAKNYGKHSKPRSMCELEEIGLVWFLIKGGGQIMDSIYDDLFDTYND